MRTCWNYLMVMSVMVIFWWLTIERYKLVLFFVSVGYHVIIWLICGTLHVCTSNIHLCDIQSSVNNQCPGFFRISQETHAHENPTKKRQIKQKYQTYSTPGFLYYLRADKQKLFQPHLITFILSPFHFLITFANFNFRLPLHQSTPSPTEFADPPWPGQA